MDEIVYKKKKDKELWSLKFKIKFKRNCSVVIK